jgi:hypothetical protein
MCFGNDDAGRACIATVERYFAEGVVAPENRFTEESFEIKTFGELRTPQHLPLLELLLTLPELFTETGRISLQQVRDMSCSDGG